MGEGPHLSSLVQYAGQPVQRPRDSKQPRSHRQCVGMHDLPSLMSVSFLFETETYRELGAVFWSDQYAAGKTFKRLYHGTTLTACATARPSPRAHCHQLSSQSYPGQPTGKAAVRAAQQPSSVEPEMDRRMPPAAPLTSPLSRGGVYRSAKQSPISPGCRYMQ